MIIAIDGPAGSGKTTVAKLLAKRLGISYLDTGATYRALTYAALEKNLDLSNEEALKQLARNLALKLDKDKVLLSGSDISFKIRKPRIDRNISLVVSHPGVRQVMVELQRSLAKEGDFVVEGRDISSVVFPQSRYQFYLDADPALRAKRRHKELGDKGLKVEYNQVENDLNTRDQADKTRKVGPLRLSEKGVFIDTSDLTIEQTVEEILKHIQR